MGEDSRSIDRRPDYEWLMIDASHCKVHPHARRSKGGNQDMSRTKGAQHQDSPCPWIRLVCRSEQRLSQKAPELIARRLYTYRRNRRPNLLADRGYDIGNRCFRALGGINVVIPPRRTVKTARIDRYLYKIRHLVERFLWLKRWRASLRAMRKTRHRSFLLFHIRCIAIWLAVLA